TGQGQQGKQKEKQAGGPGLAFVAFPSPLLFLLLSGLGALGALAVQLPFSSYGEEMRYLLCSDSPAGGEGTAVSADCAGPDGWGAEGGGLPGGHFPCPPVGASLSSTTGMLIGPFLTFRQTTGGDSHDAHPDEVRPGRAPGRALGGAGAPRRRPRPGENQGRPREGERRVAQEGGRPAQVERAGPAGAARAGA